ncbi:hypothetical protein TNCV_4600511 [Trichonephila clavipes]|nr:hypothetical protein TNCV_4600511 [Trichonephila clavipes]
MDRFRTDSSHSLRAASPLVRWVEGKERWVAPDAPPRVFSLKIGVESSKIVLSPVWCSRLRPTMGVYLALCHDEFCGPRSDTVKQGILVTTIDLSVSELLYTTGSLPLVELSRSPQFEECCSTAKSGSGSQAGFYKGLQNHNKSLRTPRDAAAVCFSTVFPKVPQPN